MADESKIIDSIFTAFDPTGAGSTKISEATGWPVSTVHTWKGKTIPEWRRKPLLATAYEKEIELDAEAIAYLDPHGEVEKPLRFEAPPIQTPPTPQQKADEGAGRAAAHAERVDQGWQNRAYSYLIRYAEKHSRFLAEDVRRAAEADGIPLPPAPGAWGNVFKRAARGGFISHDGYEASRLPSTHGKAARVWVTG